MVNRGLKGHTVHSRALIAAVATAIVAIVGVGSGAAGIWWGHHLRLIRIGIAVQAVHSLLHSVIVDNHIRRKLVRVQAQLLNQSPFLKGNKRNTIVACSIQFPNSTIDKELA
ncbi:hypothetical protein D1872_252090 [compost metagenome]